MPAARSDTLSRRQKVADAIQKGILNEKLKPGQPLRQIPLSRQHRVSQSAARLCCRKASRDDVDTLRDLAH